ncbi:MAG: nitrous oxide reductase accessory protein NosL [Roseovarius sp.]|jgi:copper chaperone NosL|uniref:nitrous oxide reductase accessory protein NosL n=1 Tax=Roseovarius sp. TaxID=1486281 RepID=UPI002631B4B3|nr:nitrous oxide reductase accessory protein NosL [Roseovarius sp.]
MTRLIALTLVALALSGCKEDSAERPLPVTMTAEAVGHYCQMDLLEHPGPKAQVHLAGPPDPLFFSQVRDAIAYQRMPEQNYAITAIYVSDMGAAPSWHAPGADNWIAADTAVYVVGATVAGGMGAPELVPFADRAAAEDFATRNGGEVLSLLSVPDEMVLAPVEFRLDDEGNFIPPEGAAID